MILPLGADAGVAQATTKNEPPARPPLSCPTPAVASAAQSCANATRSAPQIETILEAQRRLLGKGSRRPVPKAQAQRLAPRPFDADEQAYLQIARAYVCNSSDSVNRTEIAYAEARQYFEAQHWEEAGTLFHDIAVGPRSDVALYAAQLSLEAFNIMATNFARRDCNATLVLHLDEYIARLCTPTAPSDEESCRTLTSVKQELQKRR